MFNYLQGGLCLLIFATARANCVPKNIGNTIKVSQQKKVSSMGVCYSKWLNFKCSMSMYGRKRNVLLSRWCFVTKNRNSSSFWTVRHGLYGCSLHVEPRLYVQHFTPNNTINELQEAIATNYAIQFSILTTPRCFQYRWHT